MQVRVTLLALSLGSLAGCGSASSESPGGEPGSAEAELATGDDEAAVAPGRIASVRITTEGTWVGSEAVAVTPHSGFQQESARVGVPIGTALQGASELRIESGPDVTCRQIVELLDDARAAGVHAWRLAVGGADAGPFRFLGDAEQAELRVGDLYMGERTSERVSASHFRSGRYSGGAERIAFVLDFGMRAEELVSILAPARDSAIHLGFHTGPF